MTQYKKKIGGKEYRLERNYHTKSKAEKAAKNLRRKEDRSARIVKGRCGGLKAYSVYSRLK